MRIEMHFRLAACLLLLAACAPARAPLEPLPPVPRAEAALPPIAERTGALRIDLVYPPEGGEVTVRDSTFVFGSTGTGEAELRINGQPVAVEPNGAFLAFLPVPVDSVYRLEASADGAQDRLERRVRVPPPPRRPESARAVILAGSIRPRGAWSALPGERIEVRLRGTPGASAALLLPDGRRVPLLETRAVEGVAFGQRQFAAESARLSGDTLASFSDYEGFFAALPITAADTAVGRPVLGVPAAAPAPATIELVLGSDTARAPLPLNLALIDPARPRVGVTLDPGPAGTTDLQVIGQAGAGTTALYLWPNGTLLTLTGERGSELRVHLTEDQSAWVSAAEVRLLPEGTPPAGGAVGTVSITPASDALELRFEMPDPLPFHITEDERRIDITIYGATANTGWLLYGATDPLVGSAQWEQLADNVYRFSLRLTRAPWGYLADWDANGDLRVRVRRPPPIDPEQPLRGLRIAIDAGHPPAGATGPTRLSEAQANLAIALRLRELLADAGAEVLMTRTDSSSVALYARTHQATTANAHLLISVHNNAFPDGVNPFVNHGTSVYYFHPHSLELARALQQQLLAELGLRDLGFRRASLALARPTWMPAALTETMFMMVPQQEAALRDPDVQQRIALAHVRGLVQFLRAHAAAARP